MRVRPSSGGVGGGMDFSDCFAKVVNTDLHSRSF